MVNYILTWEKDDGDIDVIYDDSVAVIRVPRGDVNRLSTVEEANLPGIYFLIGPGLLYVGQASGGVEARLRPHDRNKGWWSHAVAFVRRDGRLDKSQLDYLERRFIGEFRSAGRVLDNGDSGNSSHIDGYQLGMADSTASRAIPLIERFVDPEFFAPIAPLVNRSIASSPEVPVRTTTRYIIDDGTTRFEASSRIAAFVGYLRLLAASDIREQLMAAAEGDCVFLLMEDDVPKAKEKLHRPLGGGLYVYANCSAKQLLLNLARINVITGRNAVANW